MDMINRLTELRMLNATVKGDLILSNRGLCSLHDIHQIFGEVDGSIFLSDNPIKSHVLGLLKIIKLRRVVMDNKVVQDILNKHLPEGDIFACQEELLDAGLDDYAKL